MDSSPPKLARRLLLSFLRDDLAEEVLGDLDEKFYSTAKTKSLVRAKVNYWYQVLNYLRPFAIRKPRSANYNYTPMFKSYFKISCRNLLKNRSYVVINTMGLGISLACCITVYLLLAFNIEFDSFHKSEKVADVFAIHTLSTRKDGSQARDHQAPLMFGPLAVQEISGWKLQFWPIQK